MQSQQTSEAAFKLQKAMMTIHWTEQRDIPVMACNDSSFRSEHMKCKNVSTENILSNQIMNMALRRISWRS